MVPFVLVTTLEVKEVYICASVEDMGMAANLESVRLYQGGWEGRRRATMYWQV